jgi:hypothetical protein
MQQQRTLTPAQQEAQIDAEILRLLSDSDAQRPWSVDELVRQCGNDTTDSLNRLYTVGLIHRLRSFVWATRAAIAADDLRQ